ELALEWINRAKEHSPKFENYWAYSMIGYVREDYDSALLHANLENRPYLQRDKYILMASILMRKGDKEGARGIVAQLRAADTSIVRKKLTEGGYSYSDPRILRQQLDDLRDAGLP